MPPIPFSPQPGTSYVITNVGTNTVIDLSGVGKDRKVTGWTFNNGENQKWIGTIPNLEIGTWNFENSSTKSETDTTKKALLRVSGCSAWKFERRVVQGRQDVWSQLRFIDPSTGHILGMRDRTDIQLQPEDLSSDNQWWTFALAS